MYTIILALHIFVCFLLIIAVLLQNGKASDVGAALGGGSGEMFGPKAPASIMNKITTIIAACFLLLSLTLAVLSGLGNKSVLRNIAAEQETIIPAEEPANNGGLTIDLGDTTKPNTAPVMPPAAGDLGK